MELRQIGGYDDATTGLRGVRRLALTDEDAQARRLVIAWMEQAGPAVRIDRVGNIYATRAGTDPTPSVDWPTSPRVDRMEMDTRVGCYAWIERTAWCC